MATNPFAPPTAGGSQATPAASPFTNGSASATDEAALNQTSETAKAPLPEIDLNDPMLTAETLTAKEGDAFAEPPPPPDRIYRVQLKLRGVTTEDYGGRDISKWAGGSDHAPWVPEQQIDRKTGQIVGVFAKTIMDVVIHDPNYPEFEGVYLQIPFKWIDTRAGRNNGPSKMMTILNLLKQPSGQPWLQIGKNYGAAEIANIFAKALAGEPEARCQSEWSWSCQVCGELAKKSGGKYPNPIEGMLKFNQVAGKPGVYNHELRCQAVPAHGFSKARAQAAQFFALDAGGK